MTDETRIDEPGRPSFGVTGCARCGKDHAPDFLRWRPFHRPVNDCRWWAMCPVTGEPILLRITVTAMRKTPEERALAEIRRRLEEKRDERGTWWSPGDQALLDLASSEGRTV